MSVESAADAAADEERQLLGSERQDEEKAGDKYAASLPSQASYERRVPGVPAPLAAGLAYCATSAGMVLLNKLALSGFAFRSITMLLLFQCAFSAVAVYMSAELHFIKLEKWNWDIARTWFPANLIFVGMLWSSFPALQLLGVGMVTVLKNLTNLFVIAGDIIVFGRRYNLGVWATLVLMTASALCAAATDLQFNAMGYMWQLINCSFTAAYSLVLRNVMDRVVPLTANGKKLDEFSMVLYNNVLSVPVLLVAAGVNATTYSLVGSLNKMPVAVLGLFFFDASWGIKNLASILVGIAASVIFVLAKQASS